MLTLFVNMSGDSNIDSAGQMRIYLIDQNELELKVVNDFLTSTGCKVNCFESTAQLSGARDQLGTNVDLILVDPGVAKEDHRREIEAIHSLYPGADIVIMSAEDSSLSLEQAMEHGVYSYLNKPFRLAELELLVARIKEKRNIQAGGR